MLNRLLLSFGLVVASMAVVTAQNTEFVVSDSTKMTISGTSTLHSWTSTVGEVRGSALLDKDMAARENVKKGDRISSVKLFIPVKSIISPRGATMDKKTYDALKSEEHPEIKFDLSNGKVREVNGNSFIVEASGSLEVAGVTRDIEFEAEGEKMSPNQYKFTGNHKINMKDYDMEPPSAMFGQIVTGEEVTINFELVLDGE